MAKQTLIRSKKQHEVALSEGSQMAVGQQAHVGGDAPLVTDMPTLPPSVVLRHEGHSPEPVTVPTPKPSARKAGAPAAKRTASAAPRKRSTPPAEVKEAPPRPRLPARVPADALWETDSAVMRRVQALIQRNAQLSEQMQRLQNSPLPKGH